MGSPGAYRADPEELHPSIIRYMQDKAVDPMLTCLRCDHEWKCRGKDLPDNCPKCHSNFWDKPRTRRIYKNGT